MNIGIIGCGLIGQKRAKTLNNSRLVICADTIQEKAESLANRHTGCIATTNWHDVINHPDVQMVIIATLHATLAEMGLAAIRAGKHILVEKPAGRKAEEITPLIQEAAKNKVLARVGFNHRYHRAFQKARELIDQGVHLIDLARWFLGDFSEVDGSAHTFYWNMPVDDNGFLLLKTPKKQVAFLHASCTEWKNLFSFEIYGRTGKIDIQGLGGSYGTERITFYKMRPEMGPPETYSWEDRKSVV